MKLVLEKFIGLLVRSQPAGLVKRFPAGGNVNAFYRIAGLDNDPIGFVRLFAIINGAFIFHPAQFYNVAGEEKVIPVGHKISPHTVHVFALQQFEFHIAESVPYNVFRDTFLQISFDGGLGCLNQEQQPNCIRIYTAFLPNGLDHRLYQIYVQIVVIVELHSTVQGFFLSGLYQKLPATENLCLGFFRKICFVHKKLQKITIHTGVLPLVYFPILSVSIINVTGPLLETSTSMWAPNSPVSTFRIPNPLACSTKWR